MNGAQKPPRGEGVNKLVFLSIAQTAEKLILDADVAQVSSG